MKKMARTIPKHLRRWMPIAVICYAVVAVASHLTNPFTQLTVVQHPYITQTDEQGQLTLTKQANLRLRTSRFYEGFVWLKSGYHIAQNAVTGGKKTKAETVREVIADIHQLRFDPNEPYLISGDHFSTLYPRSLGIFYHSLLDPRTALNEDDWIRRQQIYLQTTAYALDAFEDASNLSTTIVPVGAYSIALMNVYAPPSDTLYSLLYALTVLQDTSRIENTYPITSPAPTLKLQTRAAGAALLEEHRAPLLRHYQKFISDVVDPSTQLIRKDILLSGTKDNIKRSSAFYDNVILWKTHALAQELGLVAEDQLALATLKQRILETFWSEPMGCFIEDLSPESIQENIYSSDWLIVLKTGLLDPQNPAERRFYEGCVAYIQENKLDQPFGLHYQTTLRLEKLYPIVRIAAPSYGGTTIWSNWGMEYVKTLALLYRSTGHTPHLITAQQQIDAYTSNIEKYRCYPEVYDADGEMFRNFLYKSVCQTGWVVSYEQARLMVQSLNSSTPTQ